MMKKFTIIISIFLVTASLTGCSGGGSSEVQVSDEQTKGGNVVTDPKLKEQLTGAANGAGGGEAATSDGPSVTQ